MCFHAGTPLEPSKRKWVPLWVYIHYLASVGEAAFNGKQRIDARVECKQLAGPIKLERCSHMPFGAVCHWYQYCADGGVACYQYS